MIFGNKDSFGIEVCENLMHSPLRLWINSKSIGDFKKTGELIDSIMNLKVLIKNIESLSENSFENATPQDIFSWILRSIRTQENHDRAKKYVRFLGEQMDNITMFAYLKNGAIEWAFYNQKSKKIKVERIDKTSIVNACNQYFTWFESNYAGRHL